MTQDTWSSVAKTINMLITMTSKSATPKTEWLAEDTAENTAALPTILHLTLLTTTQVLTVTQKLRKSLAYKLGVK